MWSVGVSVYPSEDAERIGYDELQINRIVVRIAAHFLGQEMRVIFDRDWREGGAMRAVADFASIVASDDPSFEANQEVRPRVLNVFLTRGEPAIELSRLREHPQERVSAQGVESPAAEDHRLTEAEPSLVDALTKLRGQLSPAASQAERDFEGVLRVIPLPVGNDSSPETLAQLRHLPTRILSPGFRICLGGSVDGNERGKNGVADEAELALMCGKPLYLLGGFGGVAREFGEGCKGSEWDYWSADNGLQFEEKQELFDTTDVEFALGKISGAISNRLNAT